MGFSVSGSFVIVLLGVFIAAGAVTTTGANTLERMSQASSDQTDRQNAVYETEITVTSVDASGTDGDCDVTTRVNNTGARTLVLNETSLLIDNGYQTDWQDGATVDGDSSTDLWHPGEQLVVKRTGLFSPDAVTVVTKTGVQKRVDLGGRSC